MFVQPRCFACEACGRRHILAVDDGPETLELLQLVLGRANHQVTLADGGQAALALLTTQALDVLLMDLHMPGMDGFAQQPLEIPRLQAEIARVLCLDAVVLPTPPALTPSAAVWGEAAALALWHSRASWQAALPRGMAGFATVLVQLAAFNAAQQTTEVADRWCGVVGSLQ